MGKKRLTERLVDGLAWDGKRRAIRDDKVAGLMVVVNKSSKSYVLQRDLWKNRRLIKTVRHLIGRTDAMSLREARSRATEVSALIAQGVDPNARAEPASGPTTLADAWAEYRADLIQRKRSERTIMRELGFERKLLRFGGTSPERCYARGDASRQIRGMRGDPPPSDDIPY